MQRTFYYKFCPGEQSSLPLNFYVSCKNRYEGAISDIGGRLRLHMTQVKPLSSAQEELCGEKAKRSWEKFVFCWKD